MQKNIYLFLWKKWVGIGLILAVMLAAGGSLPGTASTIAQPPPPFETLTLPEEALAFTPDIPSKQNNAHPKLGSILAELVAEAHLSRSGALDWAEVQGLRVRDDRVQVHLSTSPEKLAEALAAIARNGGEATVVSLGEDRIQAWVPVSVLASLAQSRAVDFIDRPGTAPATPAAGLRSPSSMPGSPIMTSSWARTCPARSPPRTSWTEKMTRAMWTAPPLTARPAPRSSTILRRMPPST